MWNCTPNFPLEKKIFLFDPQQIDINVISNKAKLKNKLKLMLEIRNSCVCVCLYVRRYDEQSLVHRLAINESWLEHFWLGLFRAGVKLQKLSNEKDQR